MRILHVANHCRRSGNGIVNVAVDLSCTQAQAGHSVAFASAKGEYVSLIEGLGVRHFEVDQRSRSPARLLSAILGLRNAIAAFEPEIVHAHMVTGALIARFLRPFFKFRLITTVHNEFEWSATIMGVGDRVIAVSRAVSESLIARGIPASKIDVSRNGVIGSPRRARGGPSQASVCHPAIVTLAGMNYRKGIGDLIEAFNILSRGHSDVHLYLVGDGPQREEFETQAAACYAPARIHFVGFVDDPRGYLQAAEIFVLASREEPFGLVLTEAREAGCAVVATDVGGIPEALDQGEAGMLLPPRRPDLLATALSSLLSEPERLRDLARRSRQRLDDFSVARMCEENELSYIKALNRAES